MLGVLTEDTTFLLNSLVFLVFQMYQQIHKNILNCGFSETTFFLSLLFSISI